MLRGLGNGETEICWKEIASPSLSSSSILFSLILLLLLHPLFLLLRLLLLLFLLHFLLFLLFPLLPPPPLLSRPLPPSSLFLIFRLQFRSFRDPIFRLIPISSPKKKRKFHQTTVSTCSNTFCLLPSRLFAYVEKKTLLSYNDFSLYSTAHWGVPPYSSVSSRSNFSCHSPPASFRLIFPFLFYGSTAHISYCLRMDIKWIHIKTSNSFFPQGSWAVKSSIAVPPFFTSTLSLNCARVVFP